MTDTTQSDAYVGEVDENAGYDRDLCVLLFHCMLKNQANCQAPSALSSEHAREQPHVLTLEQQVVEIASDGARAC